MKRQTTETIKAWCMAEIREKIQNAIDSKKSEIASLRLMLARAEGQLDGITQRDQP